MAECKRSIPVVFFGEGVLDKGEAERMDAHGAGAMSCDEDVMGGGSGFIYLYVPADNEKGWRNGGALHVRPKGSPKPEGTTYPSWEFTGTPGEKDFTLHPSVHLVGTWHGWL